MAVTGYVNMKFGAESGEYELVSARITDLIKARASAERDAVAQSRKAADDQRRAYEGLGGVLGNNLAQIKQIAMGYLSVQAAIGAVRMALAGVREDAERAARGAKTVSMDLQPALLAAGFKEAEVEPLTKRFAGAYRPGITPKMAADIADIIDEIAPRLADRQMADLVEATLGARGIGVAEKDITSFAATMGGLQRLMPQRSVAQIKDVAAAMWDKYQKGFEIYGLKAAEQMVAKDVPPEQALSFVMAGMSMGQGGRVVQSFVARLLEPTEPAPRRHGRVSPDQQLENQWKAATIQQRVAMLSDPKIVAAVYGMGEARALAIMAGQPETIEKEIRASAGAFERRRAEVEKWPTYQRQLGIETAQANLLWEGGMPSTPLGREFPLKAAYEMRKAARQSRYGWLGQKAGDFSDWLDTAEQISKARARPDYVPPPEAFYQESRRQREIGYGRRGITEAGGWLLERLSNIVGEAARTVNWLGSQTVGGWPTEDVQRALDRAANNIDKAAEKTANLNAQTEAAP